MSWVTLVFVLLLFPGSAASAFQIPKTEVHFISYDILESRLISAVLSAGRAEWRTNEKLLPVSTCLAGDALVRADH